MIAVFGLGPVDVELADPKQSAVAKGLAQSAVLRRGIGSKQRHKRAPDTPPASRVRLCERSGQPLSTCEA